MITAAGRRAAASATTSIFVFAFLIAAISSCTTVTPTPSPALPAPAWEPAQLIEALKQRDAALRSVRALARVDYAGPEGKHSFQEAVLVERPDRLRLETLTMLGVILIVTANDKELIGYHPREGVFVRGQRSKENLRRYTQMPLELEEITRLLIGLPPLDVSASWQQDGTALIFSGNGRRDVVAFESAKMVPTQWQRFASDGKVELSAQFNDYVSTPAGLFPARIIFEAHLQKRKVEIRFQEPELNPKIPAELFSQQKPPHVQELPIEAVGS